MMIIGSNVLQYIDATILLYEPYSSICSIVLKLVTMKTASVHVTTVNNSDTSADRDGCDCCDHHYYDHYYDTTVLYKAHYRTILL
mgnify:FL=1